MKISGPKIFFTIGILFLIGLMIHQTFNQSGIKDLKGGFVKVAEYRNENNTGPVQRIYAVTVKNLSDAAFEQYGDLMPHNKYGNTKVYFFEAGKPHPTRLEPGELNFDPKYNSYCIALYEKNAVGNSGLVHNPFNQ